MQKTVLGAVGKKWKSLRKQITHCLYPTVQLYKYYSHQWYNYLAT